MSCETCFQSVKGMQQAYKSKRDEAIKWQHSDPVNNIAVAIYQEGYDYYFIDAQAAITEGMLIREIITFHE